jgi:sucrose-6-phosphatase
MNSFLLVTDLDNTLVPYPWIGDAAGDVPALNELNQYLTAQRQTNGSKLVYATGRSLKLYRELETAAQLLKPDILITAVGSAIYQSDDQLDPIWANHLAQDWDLAIVQQLTQQFPQLQPQPESEQSAYKVSFFLKPEDAMILPALKTQLADRHIQAQVIYSSEKDLDILPQRADKGKALTYVREMLGFAPTQTIACGDSGNDIALFTENTLGIIVGNARSELRQWHVANPHPHHYLAQSHCAAGILEGLKHFNFRD